MLRLMLQAELALELKLMSMLSLLLLLPSSLRPLTLTTTMLELAPQCWLPLPTDSMPFGAAAKLLLSLSAELER